jgi:cytochrome P450
VHESFDPLSAEFLADPFVSVAQLRDGAPIFYAPAIDYYVLTRYADVAEVFHDPVTYSAAAAQLPLVPIVAEAGQILLAGGHRPQPSMVSLDGEAHERLRRPTTRAFTVKRINDMAPTIRARVRVLLDGVTGLPTFDVASALCAPLPADVIFSLMGVPHEDYAQLRTWCGSRAALGWGRPAPEEQVAIATAMASYRRYLRRLVDTKITDPGDDLTTDLLTIHRENPDRLGLDEIASILFSLSFAGHETTSALIGNTVRRLLETRGQWAAVVADRSLIPGAVEEALRFDPSVPVWRRVTTRAVTLGGVDLPEGAKLFLWLAATGRDAAVFPDPDTFDPQRPNARTHLAFGGKSVHYCLGANLGRLETVIAIEELADRYPVLALPPQSLPFHPNISFRGPQHMTVAVGGAEHVG